MRSHVSQVDGPNTPFSLEYLSLDKTIFGLGFVLFCLFIYFVYYEAQASLKL
jgi:hypothetical protein